MTTSKIKRKYNKVAYSRYEFSARKESMLNYLLEEYRNIVDDSLSNLIKRLLCEYFGIGIDDIYVPYYLSSENGRRIEVSNKNLDRIFKNLKVKHAKYDKACEDAVSADF
jgi:hypothetical protein